VPRPARLPPLVAGALLGLVALVVVRLLQDGAHWNFSEGVYALTARLLLDGQPVYGEVVAAQPPVLFVVGAGILAVSDTIEWLRLAVAALQLGGGVLAAVALRRLGAPRASVAAAPALALLLPWAVHEHGALTPETVGLPLLLGASLLVARRGGAPWAALLLSLAVFTKVTFLLPAVALTLVAVERRRLAAWLAGALILQAGLWTAIFGGGLWDDAVVAQSDSATRSVRYLAEVLVQAGWNLAGPLAGAAALAVLWWRARGAGADGAAAGGVLRRDPAQLRASAALAAAMLLTTGTMLKDGTALNVLVPVEAALLPVALLGLALAWRAWPAPGARAVLVVLAAFPLVQSAALLARPDDPVVFLRPLSAVAWNRALSGQEVDREVARARACPAGVPYSGAPYLAFVAGRRMPADQPDLFLTSRSSHLRGTLARMNADVPRCP
jgi:hypothetical protein